MKRAGSAARAEGVLQGSVDAGAAGSSSAQAAEGAGEEQEAHKDSPTEEHVEHAAGGNVDRVGSDDDNEVTYDRKF